MDEKDSSPIPVGYQMLQYLRGHREVICSQRRHNSLYLKATTIKPKITKKTKHCSSPYTWQVYLVHNYDDLWV